MDIGFSEEQEMLRAAARKFLDEECPTTFVRRRMETLRNAGRQLRTFNRH